MNQLGEHKSAKNVGWIVLLLSVIFVLATYIPYVISIRRSDEEWEYVLPFAFALFGILPAGIVFYLNEFLLKKIINFQKTRLSNQLAVACGFAVGIALVLMAVFLLWRYSNSTGYYSPFSEFLFLPKNTTFYFFNFELKINPFLIPNFINVISSPYIGWKINKSKPIETTLATKE